ncbi:MAG: hypothetical protein JWN13_3603 [Betaproteobacteria bacterium]|nr:hypothetical protein [Betaproteobacteria bacterium]
MSFPRCLFALATVLMLAAVQLASAATGPEARNRLQQQQLHDTLDLNLLQSAPGRPGNMAPADTLRLDQLQLRQRMQQQQLEQQQLSQQQLRRIDPTFDHRGALQQQQFAQERQLQVQQFDMEQRQLLGTIKPQPLQRPAPPGQLQP